MQMVLDERCYKNIISYQEEEPVMSCNKICETQKYSEKYLSTSVLILTFGLVKAYEKKMYFS